MFGIFSHGMLILSFFVSLEILESIPRVIQESNLARIRIMASRDPCPILSPTKTCNWEVYSRNYGQWELCSKERPPSGAHLPIHRWFHLKGACVYKLAHTSFSVPVISHTVYR